MADLVLTRDDLRALTGYRQTTRQIAWLTSRGWIFEPPARRGDHPKVARAYYDARMSGQPLPGLPRRSRVNLEWMLQST